jgi:hypothetical protein
MYNSPETASLSEPIHLRRVRTCAGRTGRSLLLLALFLGLVPTARAGRTWYVDGVNGNDQNDCRSPQTACKTIGNAISLAGKGDLINVAAATYTENFTIAFTLKIVGAGAATTIIDGGGLSQIIVGSNPSAHVTLSQVTLRNGGGNVDGGAIYNCFSTVTVINSIIAGNSVFGGNGTDGFGGAIYNCPSSTLTIIDSTLSGNSAEEGGAICNGGKLTIINSTFSQNTGRQRGGGIKNYGVLTITNSTFSGNISPRGSGGGIQNGELFGQKGTAFINNSTLSGNTAGDAKGGGIFNLSGATAVLQNTIVANNTGTNCFGALVSNGYNLSSDAACRFNGAGDLNNMDPNLGPLQNNGGPTETMALLPGSPAIDSGNPAGCTDAHGQLLKTDQRGMPRPDKGDSGGCDRGAYESQQH